MRLFTILIMLFASQIVTARSSNIPEADFIESMTDGNQVALEIMQDFKRKDILEAHYNAKRPSKMPYYEKPLIPKVMHHIWDGEIPPLYQNYLNECKRLHPDWEFKFWTDQDIRQLGLNYQDLYDKMRNYSGKSDIARYEILYKFGGVYRDLDVKCLKSINDLNHFYDFYAPIEYPVLYWDRMLVLNNGLIGSKAENPIILDTLKTIKEKYDQSWHNFDQNAENLEFSFMVAKTSMLPLSEGFLKNAKLDDKSIALPATYFYSLSNATYNNLKAYFNYFFTGNYTSSAFAALKPESIMFHNASKSEVPRICFCKGNNIGDPTIKRLFDNLTPSDQIIYKVFKQAYTDYMPKITSWNKESKVPQVINFVVFDNAEMSTFQNNMHFWQTLNRDFQLHVWQMEQIAQAFPELKNLNPQNQKENLRLYLGLKVLEKFGGSYAHFSTIPNRPIFELSNKYNFYAGLASLMNSKTELLLSNKLLGASKMHPIISKTLAQINPNDETSLDKINSILKTQSYLNICLYDAVSAKNIILPAVFFDPIAKEDNSTFTDNLLRFILRKQRAFTKLTEYVIAS